MRSVSPPAPHPRTSTVGEGVPLDADEAIDTVRHLLQAAESCGSPAAVWVGADALRVVLELVEGGEWDEFDGHRRWAGPWRRAPR